MSKKSVYLKECYERLHDDLQQVDNYVQKITADAYRNVYLISNQVLSRNPFTSKLLHNFHFRVPVRVIDTYELIWKLFKFYLKNLLYLLNHIIMWLTVRFFYRSNFRHANNPVIIDNFLLVASTLTSNSYEEKYFPGLREILLKRGRDVYIFPCFDKTVSLWNKGAQLFKIIRKSPVFFITEYDLLTVRDLLSLVRFICFYPIAVIRLSRRIDNYSYLGQLLSSELLETLDKVAVHSYIRYLAGKRLADCFDGKITIISWFENQVQQKSFYRGIRDATQRSVIYGCRAYIDFPAYLNSFVADAEISAKVTPDRILVNGSAYMRRLGRLEYHLGVAFRYKYLFSPVMESGVNKTQCLLFLSYFNERNRELIALCLASVLNRQFVKVRSHPAIKCDNQPALPVGWAYDISDRCGIFYGVAIIITSESGIAVEAAALGVSVIVVANQSSFTCNPMFDYGRGVIWDLVFDAAELDSAYERLMMQRTTNNGEIKRVAAWYKSSCFVEPTEENIVCAFDLI